jgi:hypothetical protein
MGGFQRFPPDAAWSVRGFGAVPFFRAEIDRR